MSVLFDERGHGGGRGAALEHCCRTGVDQRGDLRGARAPRSAPDPAGGAGPLLDAPAAAFARGRSTEAHGLLRDVCAWQPGDVTFATADVLLATFSEHDHPRRRDPAASGVVARELVSRGQPLTAFSVLLAAGPDPGVRATARALALSRPSDAGLGALTALHERDFTSALRLLSEASREAEDRGELGVLAHLRTLCGELSVHLGSHGVAQPLLAQAIELSEASLQPAWHARALAAEATRAVLCEEPHRDLQVRSARRMALSTCPQLGDRAELLEATALAAGARWTDAFDLLARLARRDPQQITHLLPAGLLSLLADAATHSGRRAEARELVSRIAAVDIHCERDVELAELLYAGAVLSEGPIAETCFEAALSLNPYRLPWHHAKASLAYGGWLRRHRRVIESRSHLLDALRVFQALDLPSWVRRAQAELRASGMRTQDDSPEAPGLSPQELTIARLVARGLTNREIGEVLHLSPRTIGSHLYRIFPKLDITSRNQLAALV